MKHTQCCFMAIVISQVDVIVMFMTPDFICRVRILAVQDIQDAKALHLVRIFSLLSFIIELLLASAPWGIKYLM